MHKLYALKRIVDELLLPLGFSLVEEWDSPDYFGSYCATYARANVRVRFVWDGKEGCALLEQRCANQAGWRQLGPAIFEDALETMVAIARSKWTPPLSAF